MPGHRDALPQLGNRLYLTDSGLETDLIFHHGVDLPAFAAFPLLDHADGRDLLGHYFAEHLALATATGAGFILEAPTWRANPDWGRAVGYDQVSLDRINADAIGFLQLVLASHHDANAETTLISGCIGPRADGYHPSTHMSADEARAYHAPQINAFAATPADLVNAMTITYAAEAIGIVQAAVDADIPVAISFTLETDGRLPDGTALGAAIEQTDEATDGAAAYFAINCAHPDHAARAFGAAGTQEWTKRLRGLRANASRRSHAELDEAPELDDGNPVELAQQYQQLRALIPSLTILGGCCGTDLRHVRAISAAVGSPDD